MDSGSTQLLDSWSTANSFKPLRTVYVTVFELISLTALELFAIFLIIDSYNTGVHCHNYFLIVYLHCAHWFVAFVVFLIRHREHHNLRMNGHLTFHRKVSMYQTFVLAIISLWSNILLLLSNFLNNFYFNVMEGSCRHVFLNSPSLLVTALITVEFVLIAVIYLGYLSVVVRFNGEKPVPDVQSGEWSYAVSQSRFVSEIGPNVQQSSYEELLEKQSDVIQYLKDHIDQLNRKIMTMNVESQGANAREE